jgi:hypothetical protein
MIDVERFLNSLAYVLNDFVLKALFYLPNIILAFLVLLVGYLFSNILTNLLKRFFDYIKLEEVFKKYKIEDSLGGRELSPILLKIFRWYVILFFVVSALEILNFPQLFFLSAILTNFVPLIFGVILLIILCAIIGEIIKEEILSTHGFFGQKTIAEISKWFVVLLGVIVSLETLGFKTTLLNQLILSTFQAFVFGIALAFALAFGLGGQKDAADIIKKVRKKLNF